MASPLTSLVKAPTSCRVSSVLDRNRVLYGGDHMLSEDLTSCWNSAQGSPQQILVQFHRRVWLRQLRLMFQGGFVGQEMQVFVQVAEPTEQEQGDLHEGKAQDYNASGVGVGGTWHQVVDHFDPTDCNDLQDIPWSQDARVLESHPVTNVRIVFHRSTDFYGRVILYRLDLQGQEEAA